MKRCGWCGEIRPVSEFYRHAQKRDGLQGNCKDCARELARECMRRRGMEVRKAHRDKWAAIAAAAAMETDS